MANKGKIGYCDICGWVVERPIDDRDRTMTDGKCDTCGSDVYVEDDKTISSIPGRVRYEKHMR